MKIKFVILALFFSASTYASAAGEGKWLEQGWSKDERQYWHYLSLGQAIAPVSWLQSLERGQTNNPLLDRRYLEGLGFQFEEKNSYNPLGLPIGFAVAPSQSPVKGHFGLTCSACHTGQISYKGNVLRFDGGTTNFDISSLLGDFYSSLAVTLKDRVKWDKFAKNVQKIDGTSEPELRKKVEKAIQDIDWANQATAKAPGKAVDSGPGRADALNRIGNFIFGQRLLVTSNYHQSNAPVNYPPLWDIWKFNWVHYNASFSQPMARNILQVLGNNGTTNFIDSQGTLVQGEDRWKTSIDFVGASKMEASFRQLSSPKWPESALGEINSKMAKNGKVLFEKNCSGCHAPYPIRAPENARAKLAVVTVPLDTIGTDPNHAKTYHERKYNLAKLTGDSSPISGSDGLLLAIDQIKNYGYDRLKLNKQKREEMDGFGRENKIRAPLAYKARTLDGIWATPPYLHNGSVPNIYELLSPASERSKQFWTGGYEYDPVNLGYVSSKGSGNYFLFDTTISGNLNHGHEFNDGKGKGIIGRKLSRNERLELIEYLKVLDQDPPKTNQEVSIDWEWSNRKKSN